MPRYLLTGGRQRVSRLIRREEWTSFEKAVVLSLDTDSGTFETLLEYEGPPDRVPEQDPSHVFKSASWDGDRLLLCTQTEVLVFDPVARRVERSISHPWFNDVHHVRRVEGRLNVVSTGLDALLELEDEGVVELHSATGESPWQRFDRERDYRRVATTKPHEAHPNYLFVSEGRRWLTRFEQGDALAIDGEGRVPVADDPIHDGDDFWFTVVSGKVVHATSGRTWDLTKLGRPAPLGWCRGLVVEPQRALVGFSRLRPTLLKQNLSWLRKPLGRAPEPAPTRVVAYDLEAGRELQSWAVEPHGISALFSILPWP